MNYLIAQQEKPENIKQKSALGGRRLKNSIREGINSGVEQNDSQAIQVLIFSHELPAALTGVFVSVCNTP